jgi:hypothetical protein
MRGYSQVVPKDDKKVNKSGVPTAPSPLMSLGQSFPIWNVQLPLSTVAAASKFSASA